jgi:hypothetical protein
MEKFVTVKERARTINGRVYGMKDFLEIRVPRISPIHAKMVVYAVLVLRLHPTLANVGLDGKEALGLHTPPFWHGLEKFSEHGFPRNPSYHKPDHLLSLHVPLLSQIFPFIFISNKDFHPSSL